MINRTLKNAEEANKAGESKLLPQCSLSIAGLRYLKKMVTEPAVPDVLPEGGFKILKHAPGVLVDYIIKSISGQLNVQGNVPEMLI